MRFINEIFTTTIGHPVDNASLFKAYQGYIGALPLDSKKQEELRNYVHFCLVGDRSRHMYPERLDEMTDFKSRAVLFQNAAEEALATLSGQILPALASAGVSLDAVITTTSTGNLMPGLSYRLAHRLQDVVRQNSLMLDLANVGCTGGCKALNLARLLEPSFQNILVVSVEAPSTLLDVTSTRMDRWQGNCTFGDGAAALWMSSNPGAGSTALALEEISYWQRADVGLDLIRWDYDRYYAFSLADETSFNNEVRELVSKALNGCTATWKDQRAWAIHPAGISLLMRLSRGLGISDESLRPSVDHYRRFSNMSSASILHILKEVASEAEVNTPIHLLTMGAGFNIIYGRARKEA